MRFTKTIPHILTVFLLAFAGSLDAAALSMEGTAAIETFDSGGALATLEPKDAACRIVDAPGGAGSALEATFQAVKRPVIALRGPEAGWDFATAAGVAIRVENPGDAPVTMEITAFGKTAGGKPRTIDGKAIIGAGQSDWLRVYFSNDGRGPYWGMHGIPVIGPVSRTMPGMAAETRLTTASSVTVAVREPGKEVRLLLDDFVTFEEDSPVAFLVPMPFVDKFGQYIQAEWPGKIHSEADLRARHEKELAALEAAPVVPGQDALGGWADGPQLEATGWFRTEKRDGKWWLVTPEGHLFLSWGVNCIYPGDMTFITGRKSWFEWLPEKDGPFSEFLGSHRALMLADAIGGEGQTVRFYAMNQKRTFGDAWEQEFRSLAFKRLRAWGFNTIANWSMREALEESTMPFTVTTGSGGGRALEASSGYWGKMMDVFDPEFPVRVDGNVRRDAAPFAANPLVVGYFVDNEMSWVAIASSTLSCPPEQPARVVFIDRLKAKYETVEALNAAWGIAAESWDAVRLPQKETSASKADAEEFEYAFAHHYFQTIAEAIDKYAPNQLYLGCRFTPVYCPKPVLQACADVVDVVSINFYLPQVPPAILSDIDKPVVIGEFHFGALDRGMFHTGLCAAANQDERGKLYGQYVRSVAEHPNFVGCHWFKYTDQPLTGRSLDGENYSIGLVTGVDVPHETFLKYVKDAHTGIYAHRQNH
ncbi:MAG TPA: beta-galactosidase [Candidatus Hydrogenedentes bacterium]|nr:beta-galactosidase [Candidatus Hydrogenedentota bacterium]HQH52399.1 beta-galactosidase [Candidatus Hydrogenedentota bacterium]